MYVLTYLVRLATTSTAVPPYHRTTTDKQDALRVRGKFIVLVVCGCWYW